MATLTREDIDGRTMRCPKCKHNNALIARSQVKQDCGYEWVYKCRDCGYECLSSKGAR